MKPPISRPKFDKRRVEVIRVRDEDFPAHDTARHSKREYARGPIHANSAEGFNDRGGSLASVTDHSPRSVMFAAEMPSSRPMSPASRVHLGDPTFLWSA